MYTPTSFVSLLPVLLRSLGGLPLYFHWRCGEDTQWEANRAPCFGYVCIRGFECVCVCVGVCACTCVSWVCVCIWVGLCVCGLYLPYADRGWMYATIPGSPGLHLFDQLVWVSGSPGLHLFDQFVWVLGSPGYIHSDDIWLFDYLWVSYVSFIQCLRTLSHIGLDWHMLYCYSYLFTCQLLMMLHLVLRYHCRRRVGGRGGAGGSAGWRTYWVERWWRSLICRA